MYMFKKKRQEKLIIIQRLIFRPQHRLNFTSSGVCPAMPYDITESDIGMIDVYAKLPFDDPDGGVWKQGYPITTSDAEWADRTLKGIYDTKILV